MVRPSSKGNVEDAARKRTKVAPKEPESVEDSVDQISKPEEQQKHTPKPDDKPVLYPKLQVELFVGPDAITRVQAQELLGWETEKEYRARMVSEGRPDLAAIGYGDEFTLSDFNGDLIRCNRNSRNRAFSQSHAYKLRQEVLNKMWRFNGENIIFSKYGNVMSGQHRLAGYILACQEWAGKDRKHWQQIWPEEPVLETSVVFGIEESPDVIRTLDNVRTRVLADVVYTSPEFDNLNSVSKRECSRMTHLAIDLLWKRARDPKRHAFDAIQTHGNSMVFMDNHPHINQAVRAIFEINKQRAISKLKLSPGMCSALLFLMGCSTSDRDDYYNADPPGEKYLEWTHWARAKQYFSDLSRAPELKPVVAKLKDLESSGRKGTMAEKIAVLCKGWNAYILNGAVTEDDVDLQYQSYADKEGLLDYPDVGGIDLGPTRKRTEEEVTPEEVEATKATIRMENNEGMLDKVKAIKEDAESQEEGFSDEDREPYDQLDEGDEEDEDEEQAEHAG